MLVLPPQQARGVPGAGSEPHPPLAVWMITPSDPTAHPFPLPVKLALYRVIPVPEPVSEDTGMGVKPTAGKFVV